MCRSVGVQRQTEIILNPLPYSRKGVFFMSFFAMLNRFSSFIFKIDFLLKVLAIILDQKTLWKT